MFKVGIGPSSSHTFSPMKAGKEFIDHLIDCKKLAETDRLQVDVYCIERNAIASVKAINASRMALRRTTQPRVTLDKVIETMYETGKDMNAKYRETSTGGLAIKILPCE
ncbi:L-serine ammonia-lyase, iron-sulfur-dependent, subunit alpha [Glaesserella parasuis]|nr:L-serine ammonia-lyase, iron-sulfur-dependent, subunit alpha [Glaesserella parasuis]MDG6285566.1 L-serine ammonia-lyase, iron-sulfur-dependent, subunit alpha [Glaesserella parasuis]MDG6287663.1 L-serine ammonia-lyase, iron-sulfur-dependent, subunit alpha [Glaesserella parasuis]MDG6289817.1 L-serine ammonia-lyase, iron-sulfur-dependent, subunit alpha [Glaesserella parasuis]MDG6291960.1 L-serine ammonia-lyase, iron-sulfur-dependent, subunit alpha [Glaesserella parasuis]